MIWHCVHQDGSKVSTLSFAITAHAGGNWSLLLHFWGRIAIQAGQGVLTSIFFAEKFSTHIHPWRTKEHDRTVWRGSFMKEGTEWPLSPYLSPSYIFRERLCNSSIPPLGGRQQSISWEYKALLAASFLFARSYFLIWGSTSKEMRQRGHVLPGWDQALPALLIPNVFPAISSHHLSVKLYRFISSVTVFFICLGCFFSAAHLWGINQGWEKT